MSRFLRDRVGSEERHVCRDGDEQHWPRDRNSHHAVLKLLRTPVGDNTFSTSF
jgi:hypothetical protein